MNVSLNQLVPTRTVSFAMRAFLPLLPAAALLAGCVHVKMDPIQVNAVVDVNVKMEREVADLVNDIYGSSATVKVPNPSSNK